LCRRLRRRRRPILTIGPARDDAPERLLQAAQDTLAQAKAGDRNRVLAREA
jgi:PleD family two-component response regulator